MELVQRFYFDHNATTPVAPEVLETMVACLGQVYGNASCIHHYGQAAKQRLEQARRHQQDGSADVRLRIQSLGMQEILTAPRSPWQNPYAERLIGSIRRECLNHYIILNARHLKRTLSSYFRYYHRSRTHLSLGKQCPFPREALNVGKIVAIPQLGGLHHRYERIAA